MAQYIPPAAAKLIREIKICTIGYKNIFAETLTGNFPNTETPGDPISYTITEADIPSIEGDFLTPRFGVFLQAQGLNPTGYAYTIYYRVLKNNVEIPGGYGSFPIGGYAYGFVATWIPIVVGDNVELRIWTDGSIERKFRYGVSFGYPYLSDQFVPHLFAEAIVHPIPISGVGTYSCLNIVYISNDDSLEIVIDGNKRASNLLKPSLFISPGVSGTYSASNVAYAFRVSKKVIYLHER